MLMGLRRHLNLQDRQSPRESAYIVLDTNSIDLTVERFMMLLSKNIFYC